MEAIRQFVKVKNNQINITLPEHFNAEEVEVIILPSQNSELSIPQWQMDEVRERSAAYFKKQSLGLNYDDAMKEIEDGL